MRVRSPLIFRERRKFHSKNDGSFQWIPLDSYSNYPYCLFKIQRCNSEFAKWHDIYMPEECADEWMQNNAYFKWLGVMNGFIIRHHYSFKTATRLDNSPQSFDVKTVSTVQFRGDIRGESGPRKLASVNRSEMDTWLIWKINKWIMPAW